MSSKPQQFLEQKLRETLAECAVPALAAVLVRDAGNTIVAAQQGVRKLGASGAANVVQPSDRFNVGSISKVFTGNLIGKLIQTRLPGLGWRTRIADVHPQVWNVTGTRAGYKDVTVEQLITHTSGLPYTPAGDDLNDWKTYTAAEMTGAKLRARRIVYTQEAVKDAPAYWPPGSSTVYSGGGIIAASMAEKLGGQTYEDLLHQHIFSPLGMADSGTGVTSTNALNGPWQHRWDASTFKTTPDTDTHLPGFDWHCRAPVGAVCCSAADLGKFIREQLRPDPQVFDAATRSTMQTHQVSTASPYVRGGWASTLPGSAQAEIWHTGDIGTAYAGLSVHLAQKMGYAAMSNMNSTFAAPAVGEMHSVTQAMHAHWNELFSDPNANFVECVHPMPAVTQAGNAMMLFARRHDGKVLRKRSSNGGQTWQAAGDFGAVVVNSGLAADVSSNGQRIVVMGRGLDMRIWFGSSADGGASWQGWTPIGAGVFLTGPSVAMDRTGNIVQVFAIGNDHRMWRTRSNDGGKTFAGWAPIGAGVFTSAPAVAASSDGKTVHVFGRGNDMRIWRNLSTDGGATFLAHWQPIGNGVFTSGPGAACAADGASVHVMARGTDSLLWRNLSSSTGGSWLAHWQTLGDGICTSAPAVVANGAKAIAVQAYAFDRNFRVQAKRSTNSGQAWSGWAQKGTDYYL